MHNTGILMLLAAAAMSVLFSSEARATLATVGDEISVSGDADNAVSPRVAVDSAGRFVVVWQSFSDNDAEWDVRARSFDENGEALGDELIVNTFTTGIQESPSVAATDNGEFVVTWSGASDGDDYAVSARFLDAGGTPSAEEVRLHDDTSDVLERGPAATGDGDGFIVAWVEDARVAGVRLDATGTNRGSFENGVTAPRRVAVDGLPGGEFVVAWSTSSYSSPHIGAYGYTGVVEGRFFDPDDAPATEFQVNSTRDDPTGYDFVIDGNRTLAIAGDSRGRFVAGFDSYVPNYVYNVDEQVDGFDIGIQTERFSSGASEGARFVSEEAPTAPGWADVMMTPGGNTVVVEDGNGILVRATDCNDEDVSDGATSIGASSGERPAVAVNEAGDIIVVWQQPRENDSGFTIAARRLSLTDACALCGDATADGRVTAVDALAALRASVGLNECEPRRCDTGDASGVTSTDALRILNAAADDPLSLVCRTD